MRSITIYVEGGGDTAQQRAELRTGFDTLLAPQKEAARKKRLKWKLVPAGSRNDTHRAFIAAVEHGGNDTLCILLVDAEEAVPAETPEHPDRNAQLRKTHLVQRDKWNLDGIAAEQVHLMVQCMEAWIAADPKALADYYGPKFRTTSLPARTNLEEEPKPSLYEKLAAATRDTQKGEYAGMAHSKIRHASQLLTRVDPQKVAARCPRFATFTAWLGQKIDEV